MLVEFILRCGFGVEEVYNRWCGLSWSFNLLGCNKLIAGMKVVR